MGDFQIGGSWMSNLSNAKKFHRQKFPFYKGRNCKERVATDTTVGTALRLFSPMAGGVVLAVMGKAYGTLKGSDPLFLCHVTSSYSGQCTRTDRRKNA